MLPPGLLLTGRYRIESFIGAAELGEVYAATDIRNGRECAIKLLPSALKQAATAWNAFQELARSVAALDADAIARLSDFAWDGESGRPFVVSERIGFPSLAELVATRGPLEPALWGRAFASFARAIDAAAANRIFHGDLKPHNLFFSPEQPGWARVSDFGMSLLRSACLTPAGAPPLGWASNEQSRGEPPSRAADIFSLGLITFYALTGRHYARAMWVASPDPAAVWSELAHPLVSAHRHALTQGGSLPIALDPWFARALNPVPGERFASAEEAARAFSELVESAQGPAPAPTLRESGSGVAAAVAAPLLFQELPKPTVARAATAPAGSAHGDAPLSSRPPGFSAPRAAATEDVSGLPQKPPVLLLAAAGAGLLLLLALGVFALSRLFSSEKTKPPEPAEAASVDRAPSAAPVQSKPPPQTSASREAPPVTRAVFVCAPVSCEWIVCDGENVKKGQLELDLAPGKHSCSASRYGFRTAVSEFQIEAGKTTRVTFELLRAKGPLAPAPQKAGSSVVKPKKSVKTPEKKGASSKATSPKPVASSKTGR